MVRVPLNLVVADAGIEPPLPPAADAPGVEVWRDNDGVIAALGQTVDGAHWLHLPRIGSFRFAPADDQVIALPEPTATPETVEDAFLRAVLPLALQMRGFDVVHGSAILAPAGVVALCAISGTGKSTLARGLSRRGYPLWADDAVAFSVKGGSVDTIPLPFALRLLPDAATFFRQGSSSAAPPRRDDRDPAAPMPLAAICVLQRVPAGAGGPAAVEVARLPAALAFPAVLAHAFSFGLGDVDRRRTMMEHYLVLSERVPVLDVRFRATGLAHLSSIIDGVEAAFSHL